MDILGNKFKIQILEHLSKMTGSITIRELSDSLIAVNGIDKKEYSNRDEKTFHERIRRYLKELVRMEYLMEHPVINDKNSVTNTYSKTKKFKL